MPTTKKAKLLEQLRLLDEVDGSLADGIALVEAYFNGVARLTVPGGNSEGHKNRSPSHFEDFWKAYPRREGANPRAPAAKIFAMHVKNGTDPLAIINGAVRYAQVEKKSVGTPYIPHATTWLNQRRWEDYPGTPLAAPSQKRIHGAPTGRGEVWVQSDTKEWDEWQSYFRDHGQKPPPSYLGGWELPNLRPPIPSNDARDGSMVSSSLSNVQ